eukprot:TRINITY_DN102603_c0_g1_i1.p1 TRINITY_DN102603_c0_g1~~TRINITY_DN102603_c0_g1_i1.p1  ORF type:complete len:260 (+),score=38.70 TRINITY_DN102603_c0_g1_i1:92-871(+)
MPPRPTPVARQRPTALAWQRALQALRLMHASRGLPAGAGSRSQTLQLPQRPRPAGAGLSSRGAATPQGRRSRHRRWSPQLYEAPQGPLSPIQEEDSGNGQCSPPMKRQRITTKSGETIASSHAAKAPGHSADMARARSATARAGLGSGTLSSGRRGTSSTSSTLPVPPPEVLPAERAAASSSLHSCSSTSEKGEQRSYHSQEGGTPPRRKEQTALLSQKDSLATPPRASTSLLRRHRHLQQSGDQHQGPVTRKRSLHGS